MSGPENHVEELSQWLLLFEMARIAIISLFGRLSSLSNMASRPYPQHTFIPMAVSWVPLATSITVDGDLSDDLPIKKFLPVFHLLLADWPPLVLILVSICSSPLPSSLPSISHKTLPGNIISLFLSPSYIHRPSAFTNHIHNSASLPT
ncbi:hypothetical protein HAX54_008323 [Datura stramonium]|uniref:Uncharacterized protein n=1 Tax=Datura stramonium TaxID=4076 RepID=A0ABS8TEF4_DATST|nr:hypothetical protein [Datura stramonium]